MRALAKLTAALVLLMWLLTACGSPEPTESPTPVAALSCSEAVGEIGGLLQEMLDVVGPRPIDFTSKMHVVPQGLPAQIDDLQRRTDTTRKAQPALQQLWDRATAAGAELQGFKETGRGVFLEGARGQIVAGRNLIDRGAVCK